MNKLIVLIFKSGGYYAATLDDARNMRHTGLSGSYPAYNLELLKAHLKRYGYDVVVKA